MALQVGPELSRVWRRECGFFCSRWRAAGVSDQAAGESQAHRLREMKLVLLYRVLQGGQRCRALLHSRGRGKGQHSGAGRGCQDKGEEGTSGKALLDPPPGHRPHSSHWPAE